MVATDTHVCGAYKTVVCERKYLYKRAMITFATPRFTEVKKSLTVLKVVYITLVQKIIMCFQNQAL